jgi:hypothetical protein
VRHAPCFSRPDQASSDDVLVEMLSVSGFYSLPDQGGAESTGYSMGNKLEGMVQGWGV